MIEHVPSGRALAIEQRHGITYCRRCGRVLVKDSDPSFVQTKPCRAVKVEMREVGPNVQV